MMTDDTCALFTPLQPQPMHKKILTHEDVLREELLEYYVNRALLARISAIVNGEMAAATAASVEGDGKKGKQISLRLLEWFVTNYAKENYTMYEIQSGDKTKHFKVFIDYKTNLNIYSKKLFAPCCRFDRILIPFDDDTMMESTLAQLNFFRWAFKNYILEYIEANYDDIKRDMELRNTVASRKRRATLSTEAEDADTGTATGTATGIDKATATAIISSNGKTRKKREELSSSACQSMRFERGVKTTFRFGA